ncbi:hypothetical protein DFH28DRAFT_931261 [Melampsora americana]|nr:hypothetical protein DFH28DRAFT_931261 [Melampsora americana]
MQQRAYGSSYSAFDKSEGSEAPGGISAPFGTCGGHYSNNYLARGPANVGGDQGAVRGLQMSQGATARDNYYASPPPPSSQFHSFQRGSSVASTSPEFDRFPTPTNTQLSIQSTQPLSVSQ